MSPCAHGRALRGVTGFARAGPCHAERHAVLLSQPLRSRVVTPLRRGAFRSVLGSSPVLPALLPGAYVQYGPTAVALGQCRGFSFPSSPKDRYRQLAAAGDITVDPRQERVIDLLDGLVKKVTAGHLPKPCTRVGVSSPTQSASSGSKGGGGFLGSLFGGGGKPAPTQPKKPVEAKIMPAGPKGLYVWGGCGTGKTFLMDMFYDTVRVDRKKRIHFHEWMIDVHERLHRLQKQRAMVQNKANTVWTAESAKAQREQLTKANTDVTSRESADDLVEQVADEMMREAWLLCFDEFQVTHISDAIIMKRLFSILFSRGAVIVATSNRPPEDLYLNGLNRPLFLPFIPMLRDFCDVHDIASECDYRLITGAEEEDRRVYIFPNDESSKKLLERKFYRIAQNQVKSGGQLECQGKRIVVPKSAQYSNVAWFEFKDLCDKPLGAADYLAIGSAYHTVFLANIPKLTLQERDQVRRFITLIDTFYEKHIKLVCTADEDPVHLFAFTADDAKNSVYDEIFAWDRTVSRLVEMQSIKYLTETARSLESDQFLNQYNFTSLTDDEVQDLWKRYDADDSGLIDKQELRFMLEDIMEQDKGHRNIDSKVVKMVMKHIDSDEDGLITYEEFGKFVRDQSTYVKW